MGKEREDPGFDEWVASIFAHPSTGKPWYEGDQDALTPTPRGLVRHLTRLFNEAGTVLSKYDDVQVARGLHYIVSPAFGGCMQDMVFESGPSAEERVDCVKAMTRLYADLWARRCLPILSSGTRGDDNPLNTECFMWWDEWCPGGAPEGSEDARAFDEACFQVLESALALPHPACQESALHGLGHLRDDYKERVEAILERYLSQPGLSDEIRTYALFAMKGVIQ